jgi:hypothetical protein
VARRRACESLRDRRPKGHPRQEGVNGPEGLLTCTLLSGWGDLNSRPLDPQAYKRHLDGFASVRNTWLSRDNVYVLVQVAPAEFEAVGSQGGSQCGRAPEHRPQNPERWRAGVIRTNWDRKCSSRGTFAIEAHGVERAGTRDERGMCGARLISGPTAGYRTGTTPSTVRSRLATVRRMARSSRRLRGADNAARVSVLAPGGGAGSSTPNAGGQVVTPSTPGAWESTTATCRSACHRRGPGG